MKSFKTRNDNSYQGGDYSLQAINNFKTKKVTQLKEIMHFYSKHRVKEGVPAYSGWR
jgi:hypothetical protein